MSEFYEYTFNGKKISFHKTSTIQIQIGRGKGIYKIRHTFEAKDFGRAVMTYNGINIGNGFKKRLVSWGLNKPLLARSISQ